MGARGPAPTPTKTLEARGSWRAGLRAGEVQFEPGAPTCPDCLKGEARKEWFRVVKQLEEAGVLQKTDKAVVTVYCEAWGEFVELRDHLNSLPAEIRVANWRMMLARDRAVDRMTRAAARLGFSPADRTRVHGGKSKSEGEQSDEGETLSYFDGTALG